MRRWKRMMSALLAGVVILGNSLFVVPKEVQASDVAEAKGNIASKIRDGSADVYLGPEGGTVQKDQKIFTWTGGTGEDQIWSAEEISDGGYRLSVAKNGNKCYLSVSDENNGTQVTLADSSESDTSQQWVFEGANEPGGGIIALRM